MSTPEPRPETAPRSSARRAAIEAVTTTDVVDWWATSIADIEPGQIRMRGYPIEELITGVRFPAMIWLLLRGDLPTPWQERLLERVLVAAVDHGPQAPSIAAARMAATCGVGLQSAMATGINLLGDVHGGAGQQCLEVLDDIVGRADGSALPETIAETLQSFRDRGARFPGFGHRFHAVDPRRDPLLNAVEAERLQGNVIGIHLKVALEVERQLATGRSKPVPMNVDGATAVILGELGFEPELARGLFVLSRSVGILAHAWEEKQGGRRIKGPIPPPLLPTYTGPDQRSI